jgi:Uma2 family endonuclease
MNAQPHLTERKPARLTVDDFLLLDRSGAFDRYAKTELINGAILVVNAQFSAHMMAKVRLLRRLADACDRLGTGLEAWSEGAVDMSPDSMPEPDLLITNIEPTGGPVACATVVLIAEIADSTARGDLGEKALLYASHAIPEYWVVDLPSRLLHLLWTPGPTAMPSIAGSSWASVSKRRR